MLYLESGSTDPAYNLALEQYAFDTLSQNDEIAMLWQNSDSVIIGLHQNAMGEIDREYLESNSIQLIRRLSGGGAVFHDLGNLNYTFISHHSDASSLDFADSSRPIADALISMGLPVEFRGRNDLTIDGKKFSGNARYYRDGKLMHHGTVLYSLDFDKMSKVLRVPEDKLFSKGIKSVRSRVVNLCDYVNMPFEEFRCAIRNSIVGDIPAYQLGTNDLDSIETIRRSRYGTWEWNYGKSPGFSIEKHRRIEGFGAIRLCMSAENGRISAFSTDGDYFGLCTYDDVAAALHGAKLERAELLKALSRLPLGNYYENLQAEELVRLILE